MLSKRNILFERLHVHVLCWSKGDQTTLPKQTTLCSCSMWSCGMMPVKWKRSKVTRGSKGSHKSHFSPWTMENRGSFRSHKHFQAIWDGMIAGRRISWTSASFLSCKWSLLPTVWYMVDACHSLPKPCGIVLLVDCMIVSFFARHYEFWFFWHVGTWNQSQSQHVYNITIHNTYEDTTNLSRVCSSNHFDNLRCLWVVRTFF